MPCTSLRSLFDVPGLAARHLQHSARHYERSAFAGKCILPNHTRLRSSLSRPPSILRSITPITSACGPVQPITATVRKLTVSSIPPSEERTLHRYAVSAAFSGKQRKFSPDEHVYRHRQTDNPADQLSHQRKLQVYAGQDAFFVSGMNTKSSVAVGVADGVGGYDEAGINSADFSQGLCLEMALESSHAAETTSPQKILSSGYKRILHEDKVAGGASTACVGVFRTSGRMSAANLGDSGFIILRHGKIVYWSPPQTHYFNCPLQLSVIPKEMRAHIDKFGGSPYSDSPQDARVTFHELSHGDVVLFATDGVWDNLSNQEILGTVSEVMMKEKAWEAGEDGIAPTPRLKYIADDDLVTSVATTLVALAKKRSQDTKLDGPFAKEVQRLYPTENYHGGKVDDICVVAVVVLENV